MDKLILLTLLSDIFTPFLTSNAGLPEEARYLSQVTLVFIVGRLLLRFLLGAPVPRAFGVLAGLSIVGAIAALANGQDVLATVWGWWLMFRYTLVGLYVYVRPESVDRLAPRLSTWCIRLLLLEVVVQLSQFANGEPPGDGITGTLGPNTTSVLVLLALWTLALAIGNWVAIGRMREAAFAASLGIVSSVLGEMKLYPIAAAAMAITSLWYYLRRNHSLSQLLPYGLLLGAVLWVFPSIYNAAVPAAEREPFMSYLSLDRLDQYMSGVWIDSKGGYDLGRGTAVVNGWERLNRSPISLAVGEGLGARGESKTLGTAGLALLAEDFGLFTGSSLVVIMGEMGLLGLAALLVFEAWAVHKLSRAQASVLPSGEDGLRYALILYSLLLPVWLWYASLWTYPIPMLLYWSALGYCLARLHQPQVLHSSPCSMDSLNPVGPTP